MRAVTANGVDLGCIALCCVAAHAAPAMLFIAAGTRPLGCAALVGALVLAIGASVRPVDVWSWVWCGSGAATA